MIPAPPTSSALAIPPPPGFVGDMETGLGATATTMRTGTNSALVNQPPPPPPGASSAMPLPGGPRPPPNAPWAESDAGNALIDPGGKRIFPFPAVGVGRP